MSAKQSGIRIAAVSKFSSRGNRPCQEDFMMVEKERKLFVVADGFGGPVAGVEASQLACEAVRGFLFKEAGDLEATLPFVLKTYYSLAGNVLFNSVVVANRKLMARNKGKNANEKGGASLIAGFIDGDLLALANVGSCSAWMVRKGKIIELVMPRTYGRLRSPFFGQIGSTGASGFDHTPLMALGLSEDLDPEIFEYRVQPGDWLFLNTVGINSSLIQELAQLQLTSQSSINSEVLISQVHQILDSALHSGRQSTSFSENGSLLTLFF